MEQDETQVLPSTGVETSETSTAETSGDETSGVESGGEQGKQPVNRRKLAIITVSAVVVALLVAGGVYAGVNSHYQQAVEPAYSNATKADTSLTASITAAEKLATTDKTKVADSKVLDALKAALAKAQAQSKVVKQDVNSMLLWQALHATSAYETDKTSADKARVTLDKAIKAVQDSVALKQLNDAKKALSDTVNSATQVLKDSDGKVADNATRDNLQKSIDSANTLLKNTKATVKQLTDSKTSVDNAVNGVNASIEAKRKADEEAAAKAAAEEAARQAAAQRSTYSGYSYSGSSYSAPRSTYSGGNAYSAPRQNTSAQAPSSGGSSGGYSASKTFSEDRTRRYEEWLAQQRANGTATYMSCENKAWAGCK